MKTLKEIRYYAGKEKKALRHWVTDHGNQSIGDDVKHVKSALKRNVYAKDTVLYRGGIYDKDNWEHGHKPGAMHHHNEPFSTTSKKSWGAVYADMEGATDKHNRPHVMKIHVAKGTPHVNVHKMPRKKGDDSGYWHHHEHILPAGKLVHTGKITRGKGHVNDSKPTIYHHYRYEPDEK
jgi:hypothetical protein